MNNNIWMPVPIYCPNCGTLNIGYRSEEKKIRYECKICKVVLVRIPKGRRHDTIEMYAPTGEEQLS